MRALLVLAVWLTIPFSQPAFAEKRVALVIGNSIYQKVAKLSNPVNDAAAVAAMLKSAGFNTVESKLDLTVSEMRKTLRDFGNSTRDADVAVIYYAGHGIELDGTNYLIPVDATLETDSDILDETLSLDRVLFAVEPAKHLRLVILDACRDNPFAKTMKRTIASRAIGRGLAKVEPSSPDTMIAFAAKAGSTAADGDSKNSPFATALVEHLAKPGLDLRKAFGFVRDDVLKATNNAQEPFIYGSLGGNDVALVPAHSVAISPGVATDPNTAIRHDYELAERVGTKAAWDSFIRNYPAGFYRDLAMAQRDRLAAEAARVEAAEKAEAAMEEQKRLAVEGAGAAEQSKAAAIAKAAADAREAAEKKKAIEEAKVMEEKGSLHENEIAALTPAQKEETSKQSQPALGDVPRLLQLELDRVGCNTGAVDGNWNIAAQRALDLFNKYAGTKLDVRIASVDTLDAIKSRTARVCPLACDHGFKADGDHCVKITCRAGYRVNDDDECEKFQEKKPVAVRKGSQLKPDPQKRKQAEPESSKPQASGQIICPVAAGGNCRPVQKGCRLVYGSPQPGIFINRSMEVCD
jgi:uncharacterized caspase-like protein